MPKPCHSRYDGQRPTGPLTPAAAYSLNQIKKRMSLKPFRVYKDICHVASIHKGFNKISKSDAEHTVQILTAHPTIVIPLSKIKAETQRR